MADDLSTYSAAALIDSIIRLTHVIHRLDGQPRADTLREQRAVAKEELLRRCA